MEIITSLQNEASEIVGLVYQLPDVVLDPPTEASFFAREARKGNACDRENRGGRGDRE